MAQSLAWVLSVCHCWLCDPGPVAPLWGWLQMCKLCILALLVTWRQNYSPGTQGQTVFKTRSVYPKMAFSYLAWSYFKLGLLLPLPPEGYGFRCTPPTWFVWFQVHPPHLVCVVLGMDPGSGACRAGAQLYSQPSIRFSCLLYPYSVLSTSETVLCWVP